MTAIVGLIDEEAKRIYIGGDSQASTEFDAHQRKDPKVFFVGDNKQMLIGASGSYRVAQLIRFSFHPPAQKAGSSDYEYMCSQVVPVMKEVLEKGGALKSVDGVDENEDSQMIVAYKGNLFSIDIDFQVGEYYTNYTACGIAKDFALGSLFSTKDTNISQKHRVFIALQAAEEFSATVRQPFHIEELEY